MHRSFCVLLITLALGLLVAPLAAHVQPPTHVHRIGWLAGTTPTRPFVEAFLEEMRALGLLTETVERKKG